jgi:hypothetical protein
MVVHNGTRLFKLYVSSRAEPHKQQKPRRRQPPFFARALFADRSARQLQTQFYTKYMEGLRAVRLGAVGAGSVWGGAVGGARFAVLRLGEGRVSSQDYVCRVKFSVAGERGALGLAGGWLGVGGLGVGGLGVGRRRVERRRPGHGRRVGQ